jgi:hypothetical protein
MSRPRHQDFNSKLYHNGGGQLLISVDLTFLPLKVAFSFTLLAHE